MRILFFALIALLVCVPVVAAVSVTTITAETLGCGAPPSIRVFVTGSHVEPPAGDDQANIDLYDGDGTHVSSQLFAWGVGQSNLTINADVAWIAVPQANPLRVVVTDSSSGAIVGEQSFSTDCISRTVDNPASTYSTSGIQISVVEEAEDEFGFSLIAVSLDGETGYSAIALTAEDLAALPESVEENTLVAESSETSYWGDVSLYLLTTGELQVNVGPDAEGKVRVTIYDGIPPTSVYGYEFNVLEAPTP